MKKIIKFEYYINEIIRINYTCNWKCIFCNVDKVNNFGDKDINKKEVILKILSFTKKYNNKDRKKILLSFSGGEPTLNKNLINYIKLAKRIGIGKTQIQTNGSILYNNLGLIDTYIEAGLDEVFIAQHSNDKNINIELGAPADIVKFIKWFKYTKNKYKDFVIYINIVITKINIYNTLSFLKILKENGIFNDYKGLSLGFVQPNGYAWKNKKDLLLSFNGSEKKEIDNIIKYSKENHILLDFHYTSPPLCILDNTEYNLEYKKLKRLEEQEKSNMIDPSLDSFYFMRDQKIKLKECDGCKYNKYCFGFYKNWIDFIGKDKLIENINNFRKGNII